MTQTIEALYRFFSGFGIPAYAEGRVPEYDELGEPVKPPYITVQLVEPDWRESMPFYARVWYRDASHAPIDAKVDEIRAAIGEGASLPTPSGAVWIYRANNFAQHMPMEGDPALKVVYLNMTLHALTN